MKNIFRNAILTLCAGSGIVLACTENPLIGAIINVSYSDIAAAYWAGYSNPARAAALMGLDRHGESLYGADSWHSNSFKGEVLYKFSTGGVIHYEDKECGKKAIEKEPKEATAPTSTGGSSGTGATGSGGSGGTDLVGSTTRTTEETWYIYAGK